MTNMIGISIEEVQRQLTQVNIAIETLIQGKSLVELRVGSGNFQRLFRYGDVTLVDLKTYRRELLDQINSLTPNIVPIFRSGACIPLVVRKGDL